MPVRLFWFYSRQVDRIRAEEDLRLLRVLAAAQSGEAMTKEAERLNQELGTVRVFAPVERTIVVDGQERDPNFDKAALDALRMKVRGKR